MSRVILLSADLMVGSALQGPAARLGIALDRVGNLAGLEAKLAADGGLSLVIVDLSAPQLDLQQVAQRVRAAAPRASLLAYGPHVQTGRLDQATQAGFDRVMSRGQFTASAAQLLAEFAGDGSSGSN